MDALTQGFARLHFSEQSEDADMACAHLRDRTEQQDHEQKCGDAQADQAKKAAAVPAASINSSAASCIENRHRSSPCCSKCFKVQPAEKLSDFRGTGLWI